MSKSFLHEYDIYGYQIPLNFNGRRTYHTTKIGGIFSLITKFLYVTYLIFLMSKMINFQDDKTYEQEINDPEVIIKGMYFRDMNIQIF